MSTGIALELRLGEVVQKTCDGYMEYMNQGKLRLSIVPEGGPVCDTLSPKCEYFAELKTPQK